MEDKIVQINGPKLSSDSYTYLPIKVDQKIPSITADAPKSPNITTGTDPTQQLKVVVNKLGEEVLPNPSLYKRNQDYYSATDKLTLIYRSVKQENLTALDQFSTRVNFKRNFTDYSITNDSYRTVRLLKVFNDTVQKVDVVRKNLAKVFNTNWSADDTTKISFSKLLLSAADISELYKVSVTKTSRDIVASQDVFSRTVDFSRSFADVVDATDDFYGLANLDDDQVAYFNKVLVSWFASTDVKQVRLSTVKFDTAVLSHEIRLLGNKILASTGTVAEQHKATTSKVLETEASLAKTPEVFSYVYGKPLHSQFDTATLLTSAVAKALSSTSAALDSTEINTNKYLVSEYTATDVYSTSWYAQRNYYSEVSSTTVTRFNIQPVYGENIFSSDSLAATFNKTAQSDVLSTADLFSRFVDYKRSLFDYVYSTDDFYGSANIDDDQTAYFNKGLVTSVATAHIVVRDLNKVLSSNAAAQDVYTSVITKPLASETNETYDQTSLLTNKGLLSISDVQDKTTFSGFITKLDSVAIQPVFSYSIATYHTDLADSSDTAQIYVNRPVIDTFTPSDVISFFKFANRYFSDIVSTGSSGTINNQSYFAGTYVEPGYVGTNTYFS